MSVPFAIFDPFFRNETPLKRHELGVSFLDSFGSSDEFFNREHGEMEVVLRVSVCLREGIQGLEWFLRQFG